MTNKVLGGGIIDGALGVNPDFSEVEAGLGRVVQSIDENGTVFYWLVETTSKGGWLLANGLYANPTKVVGDSLPIIAGSFVDGFTLTKPNQVGIDSSGDEWKYIGDGSLPVVVTPNTNPSASVDFKRLGKPSNDDYLNLKIFQTPTNGGLTEIQTRTVDAGEVYEVRKTSDDSLATIYSDAAGTTEILQDGTSNKSGSDGVVKFYIADGDYYVDVDSVKSLLQVIDITESLEERPKYRQVMDGVEWESKIDSTRTMLNWSNFQGQGKSKSEQLIPAILHDYTDAARSMQIDKVGGDIVVGDYILGLRRASNNVRRPDKSSEYISDAGFLKCTYDQFNVACEFTASITGTVMTVTNVSSGALAAGQYVRGAVDGTIISSFGTGTGGVGTYNVTIKNVATPQTLPSSNITTEAKVQVLAFYIGKTGDFGWAKDKVSMLTGYAGAGHAYNFRATSPEVSALALFESYNGVVLSLQDTVGNTRTDLVAGANQTSGMALRALGGGINLEPKAGSNITVRGPLVAPPAQNMTLQAINAKIALNSTDGVFTNAPFKFAPYSVSNLPEANNFIAHTVYVSDGDSGQPCLATSVGGVWRRVPLGAAVSTS